MILGGAATLEIVLDRIVVYSLLRLKVLLIFFIVGPHHQRPQLLPHCVFPFLAPSLCPGLLYHRNFFRRDCIFHALNNTCWSSPGVVYLLGCIQGEDLVGGVDCNYCCIVVIMVCICWMICGRSWSLLFPSAIAAFASFSNADSILESSCLWVSYGRRV